MSSVRSGASGQAKLREQNGSEDAIYKSGCKN